MTYLEVLILKSVVSMVGRIHDRNALCCYACFLTQVYGTVAIYVRCLLCAELLFFLLLPFLKVKGARTPVKLVHVSLRICG